MTVPAQPLVLPLFESLPDALIIVDGLGTVAMANGNAHQLFGYGPGELVGIPVEDLVPGDARERHRVHRGDYMARPRVRPMGMGQMTLGGQRLDGRQFPVEIALSPVDTKTGTYYLASIRDVSETQRVRQALVRARYDAVVAQIGQLALASITDERLVARTPQLLADVLGVPSVAIVVVERDIARLRSGVGMADPLPPWLSPVRGPLHEALGGPKVVGGADEADGSNQGWPPGASDVAVVPLLNRGNPVGALVAVAEGGGRFDHDAMQLLQTVAHLLSTLVQRRDYEEQLAHSRRLEAIGQLTGGVAHDFNNLLTVISGSLQMLEADCDRDGAREIIDGALRSVARGAELTGKLLAFARRQHLSPRALAPSAVLVGLEPMLRGTLGEGIEVRMEHPGVSAATFVDASQLDNALLNLAINARDAMPTGGALTIAASEQWIMADAARPSRMAGHYISFRVSDTGGGMSTEALARAFEPFFTTKGPGRGSGLGLSMVYGFVRQSGGFVEITSREGAGTSVEMFLPVAEPNVAEAANAPPRQHSSGSATGGGECILLVEDEEDVRRIAAAFLETLGYRVIATASAEDALAVVEQGGPDIALLFSDVVLGSGMNGIELALAARRQRPGLGVLLVSGYDPVRVPVKNHAGFEVLRKPYRREQLAAALRRSLHAGGRS